jgi:hypothetical protein
MKRVDIFCPKCAWTPRSESRWTCTKKLGGCGITWNTFDTRGICPKCSCKWEITQCHGCKDFSLHKDWYHSPSDDSAEEQQRKADLVDA